MDMHIVDELCHYTKPVSAGGRYLTIRVILGPQPLGHFIAAALHQCFHTGRLPTSDRNDGKTRNSKIWD
eukprot:scaffold192100_cov34-Attheya_sp.AAC.3